MFHQCSCVVDTNFGGSQEQGGCQGGQQALAMYTHSKQITDQTDDIDQGLTVLCFIVGQNVRMSKCLQIGQQFKMF